ncbi:MAG: VPLPA-CTERM sorting domain-containing protein, partial [Rhodospirillaceae bacterium]|nr:VPLPA-CTERM sorting domain-containing protein [Rhodospirillaceae bacterium]
VTDVGAIIGYSSLSNFSNDLGGLLGTKSYYGDDAGFFHDAITGQYVRVTDVGAIIGYSSLSNFSNDLGGLLGTKSYYGDDAGFFSDNLGTLNPVPLPATVWMFLTALGGLGLLGRRRSQAPY